MTAKPVQNSPDTDVLEFASNAMAADFCGRHDENLVRLENALHVTLNPLGNKLSVIGSPSARMAALRVIGALVDRLEQNLPLEPADIDAALRLFGEDKEAAPADRIIQTPRRKITPRSRMQAQYIEALERSELVFGLGPAGTGKTYLAVAQAVAMYARGEVERIVLSRPAVEAGERIGFLPGDMKDKVDPYLRPLYDALYDMMPGEKIERKIAAGEIEIAPLAFMRGRTLSRAFIILDEAQNAAVGQMKMFLTRLGEGARMAVTGDPSQVDLPAGQVSGLEDAATLLSDTEGVAQIRFSQEDVVRHDLVRRIVDAYNRRDAGKRPLDERAAKG
ncbi:MAG: PhoH family protein [Parvularculaceae bacterium]